MSFGKLIAIAGMIGVAAPAAAVDAITDWSAANGKPTDIAPPWVRGGPSGSATVAGGIMTVTGRTYFEQDAATTPGFNVARAFAVEASARYVSGSSASTREGMNMFFTTGNNIGGGLYIGNNYFYLATSNGSNSAVIAVDTTVAFHKYRLSLGAPSNNGLSAISVYYDDILKLTGSTFSSVPYSGPDMRFDFGGGSSLASATSEWKYVRDYVTPAVGAVPEPATWALMLGGFGIAGSALRRRVPIARVAA